MTETTRLHISPLTPDLFPSVIPPSLRSAATDVSFHEIPTFPENSYGYITLPSMDADKIKKKLNGSILKGKKFKIETARPSKRHLEEVADQDAPVEKKKSKRRRSEDGVLDGFELPSGRKVKRGWTEPANGKKDRRKSEKRKNKEDNKEKPQPKSKYSEKAECLFHTKIPPNRTSNRTEDEKKSKKNKKKTAESVVHEFSQTVTHPSFLRASGDVAPLTTAFEEGKGWVDDKGNVKETASAKSRKKDYIPGQVPGAKEKRSTKTSALKGEPENPQSSSDSEDWTSSSGSSDETSDSESEDGSSSDDSGSSGEIPSEETMSTETKRSLDSPKPSPDASDPSSVMQRMAHPRKSTPLEALFKRPTSDTLKEQPAAADAAGFSFFGNNDDIESEEEPQVAEPQTPFTPFAKRDLQARGLRSAAPTPDTSMAGRHFSWNEDADIEDDDDSIDTPVSKSRGKSLSAEKDETEFAKWFWENRGDNNRAWKKRRRDAAKEQRQRENRKKGMKGKS
ncbi:hypothetical protein N7468_001971 [Penicillium chermesinum]|uniref:Suppressor protein SRP40 n=1 Tax=Penicillium chermesinum TaxID=63820 RepID=A0A9W9PJS0_9EURO|nr:uncharacterized protein N7468_001971 [Penicillium chermesinum]KAJ5246988.1 hypothetical protein N7468_001971 [Penicillium chermesinum]